VPTTAAQRRGERATHRLDAEKVWVMREPGGTEDSHESSMTSIAAAQDPDPSSSRLSLGITSSAWTSSSATVATAEGSQLPSGRPPTDLGSGD
jgi:hypothetical protein